MNILATIAMDFTKSDDLFLNVAISENGKEKSNI
tara:strand:+ start:278 stop:379 length:102 start_codon:yes stop_codon:yes gene_type:complete